MWAALIMISGFTVRAILLNFFLQTPLPSLRG